MKKEFNYLFQAVGELEEEHPQSMSWHIDHGVEEAGERQDEMHTDPNYGQLKKLLEENTDMFLNTLTVYFKAGVGVGVIVNMALAKIILVRERWEQGLYPKDMVPNVEYTPPYFDDSLE